MGERVSPMQGTGAWAGRRRHPCSGTTAAAAQAGRLKLRWGEESISAVGREPATVAKVCHSLGRWGGCPGGIMAKQWQRAWEPKQGAQVISAKAKGDLCGEELLTYREKNQVSKRIKDNGFKILMKWVLNIKREKTRMNLVVSNRN